MVKKRVSKYSIEDAKNLALDRGGKCLSNKYKDANSKLKWKCENNHIWEATFAQLNNQKSWCDKCHRQSLEADTKANLIKKLISFYAENNRTPKRREFDYYLPDLGSSSSARFHWGSYNNFIKANGHNENFGIFGNIWRLWEKLVFEILHDQYQDIEIFKQFHDKETNTLVDFYIPKLELAIDAKTSNYDVTARNMQSDKYIKQYKKVQFYCLNKDDSQPEKEGVEYFYGKDLINEIKSKKVSRKLKSLLIQDEKFKLENGLITKKEIITEINILAKELGRTPKMREYSRDVRFSNSTTICNIFGSWNKALLEAGLQPVKQFCEELTEDEAILQFKKALMLYKKENGSLPNGKEFLVFSYNNESISWKTVRVLTGKTYRELINELGFKLTKYQHPKLLNIEEIKIIAKEKNLVVISKKFLGNKSKLKLKCEIHNKIVYKTLQGLRKSKTSCPLCYKLHMASMFKADIQEVEIKIKKLGFNIIDKSKFNGIKLPLDFKCATCCNVFSLSPVALYRKGHCSYCYQLNSRKEKFPLDTLNNYFASRGLALLSKQIINSYTKLEFKCLKHNFEFKRTLSQVKSSKFACSKCEKEYCSNLLKSSLGDVKGRARLKGFKLLPDQIYVKAISPLKFVCLKCGLGAVLSYNSLSTTKGCQACLKKKKKNDRYSLESFAEIFEFKKVQLISKKIENSTVRLKFLCKIHKIPFERSINRVKEAKYPCPICHKEAMSKRMKKS